MKSSSLFFPFSIRYTASVISYFLLSCFTSCTKSTTESGVSHEGSGTLSEVGAHASAVAGNKIFFAGGYDSNANDFSRTVDIYDVSNGQWSTTELSQGRGGVAGAGTGNKILFAGGLVNNKVSKIVDIYDLSSNSWTTAELSEARNFIVAAATGNKIVFAGGLDSGFSVSKTVDIYDITSNTWATAQLSEARYLLAAAAIGNKILFAGGTGANQATATVDIYDVVSNTWTTSHLSEARFSLAGAATGDELLFAGGLANGGLSDRVDIFHISSNTWSTSSLSEARENLAGCSANGKIFFGGGNTIIWPQGGNGNLVDQGASKTIDIFDAGSGNWYTDQLSLPRENPVAAGSGNKILFAGGAILDSAIGPGSGIMTYYYRFPKTVDIFTVH